MDFLDPAKKGALLAEDIPSLVSKTAQFLDRRIEAHHVEYVVWANLSDPPFTCLTRVSSKFDDTVAELFQSFVTLRL